MEKGVYFARALCLGVAVMLILTGCSGRQDPIKGQESSEREREGWVELGTEEPAGPESAGWEAEAGALAEGSVGPEPAGPESAGRETEAEVLPEGSVGPESDRREAEAGALAEGSVGSGSNGREADAGVLTEGSVGPESAGREADAGVSPGEPAEPVTTETDWSEYFDGFQGAAVLYDASAMEFKIYNEELALTRRSPCSTFKIVSSLIALENGILEPEDSTRPWSGETFWNEKWNRDIDFGEAFRASCVWYFREVIDEIGQELMQEELDKLLYGNRDISDWEGRLNTNNDNRALTGFWIESSLAISPKEQTEVMERIFGRDSAYSPQARDALKEVMLAEQDIPGLSVYGKTGMGKDHGMVVDAWYAGFAENTEENIYFCVYLGRTDHKDVSSAAAKEIAIRLITDQWGKGSPVS